jgi:SSS family solute:Na+ symporter
LDYLIIIAYFGVVIYIGLRVRASVHSGEDFFLSGRSLPAITTGLAFVAANMGSFELMGASATGAKYGTQLMHRLRRALTSEPAS